MLIKVPKFIDLASNWTKRTPTEAPTEAPTAIEVEEKRSRREVDIKKKPIKKKNPPKKTYIEFVKLTEEEHEKLISTYGEKTTNEFMERLNGHIGSKGDKYKSHYHTILNWLRRDGISKREQEKTAPKQKCPKCGGDLYEHSATPYCMKCGVVSEIPLDNMAEGELNGKDNT